MPESSTIPRIGTSQPNTSSLNMPAPNAPNTLNRPKIKMCGLSREQDIACVNALLPDFVGFVFASSTRQVSPKQAQLLKSQLDSRIKAVGVFVSESVEEILELVDSGVLDCIQLHDSGLVESGEYFAKRESKILALKSRTNAPIIKAIAAISLPNILAQSKSAADLLLLDNAKGGSGECFDWGLLEQAREAGFDGMRDRGIFLAGGLHAGNLRDALKLHPYGIDLSKGLESNGLKDCAKMREIMGILRRFADSTSIESKSWIH